ncbi:MAG: hypothetical protein IJD83_00895 [Clostridia bacterium]|nr:hypothetical protein [Clostridia bacterium]
MTERRERMLKKRQRTKKIVLLILLLAVCVISVFFACKSILSDKPLPIVYQKNNALMVQNNREKNPFIVSNSYNGGMNVLIEDGKALLFVDANGALCYSKIKNAENAANTKILADGIQQFVAPDDKCVYYIRDEILYENNFKGEKEIAKGVTDYVATKDGRFLFFNTATDLFGLCIGKNEPTVRIAENVNVYNLLRDANDWSIDSENMYYIAAGKFAHLNEDLTETVLSKNAAIGFLLNDSVFAITRTQIGEEEYISALMMYGEETKQITTDIVGSEAVSQQYTDKTYMLFTKASENTQEAESYYTLDAEGNFRYLCENDNYQNLFANADGSKVYLQTENGVLLEYSLTKNAALKTDSEKRIAVNVQSAYPVKDHIGVSGENQFGIYHNDRYEEIYNDGEPHYPKLLVENNKAYICDQAGTAPFYICHDGKLSEIDNGVITYSIVSDKRVAYLKTNESNGVTYDLYKVDGNKKPVLIDTDITSLL